MIKIYLINMVIIFESVRNNDIIERSDIKWKNYL